MTSTFKGLSPIQIRPHYARNLCLQFAIALATGMPAHAQCQWEWFGESHYPGVSGPVNAMIRWDPDGAGPQAELLIVGGKFLIAGNTIANNIAAWDGHDWEPLGLGVNDEVLALTEHGGALYAGGRFTTAGGITANYIAAWDGMNWLPLSAGPDAAVAALASIGGELWVGGHFGFVGSLISQGITRWDGVQWHGMGIVFNVSPTGNGVLSIVPYGADVVVAGDFTKAGYYGASRVALWNGNQWSSMSTGLNARVHSLTVHNGELFAGGAFTQSGTTLVASVARWDGTQWQQVGDGLTASANALVRSLTEFDGELVAVGSFTNSGAAQVTGTAIWDGQSWQAIPGSTSGYRKALEFRGELAVASPSSLRIWNGIEWKRCGIGIGNYVDVVAPYKNGIVAGGDVRLTGSIGEYVLLKSDTEWGPLGTGLNGRVNALKEFEGDLIAGAGGQFSNEMNVPDHGVKRWDGANWTPMGQGIRNVNALAVYRGRLIVGGGFFSPGFLPPYRIAQWNGTEWESMGTGFNDNNSTSGVYALTEFEGDLIAGGYFSKCGETTVNSIARWNGTNWQPFGNGLSRVLAVAVFRGELYASGRFSFIPGQFYDVGSIARWTGNLWVPVGEGVDGDIESMTVFNGDLVVGGQFTSAGGVPASNLAAWDGTAWHAMGPIDAFVSSLSIVNGSLVVGGQFYLADNKVAINVARFARTGKLGDSDGNDFIELADYIEFSTCFSGVENPGIEPYPSKPCFCAFNSDGDSDIDLIDYAAFQRGFGS